MPKSCWRSAVWHGPDGSCASCSGRSRTRSSSRRSPSSSRRLPRRIYGQKKTEISQRNRVSVKTDIITVTITANRHSIPRGTPPDQKRRRFYSTARAGYLIAGRDGMCPLQPPCLPARRLVGPRSDSDKDSPTSGDDLDFKLPGSVYSK